MKKSFVIIGVVTFTLLLSSCELEYVGDVRYHHYWGYEHAHYPEHHEGYNHGYHHDAHGGEINEQRR